MTTLESYIVVTLCQIIKEKLSDVPADKVMTSHDIYKLFSEVQKTYNYIHT